MKFLYDYFPIIIFFITYKLYGIFIATAATMAASFIQVSIFWLRHRRFERVHLITLGLIILLGGITLLFHDAIFIKWKPSVLYWLFSLFLFGSQFIGKRPLLARMLSEKITMPDKAWNKLNLSWSAFFFLMGFLNLYVVYHYSTNAWVNFKLFGTLGLTFLFMIAQIPYISKHMSEPDKAKGK